MVSWGERGDTGERGERGERGDPGHEGVRGQAGGVAPDDLDRLVTQVTGDALKESRVRATDKRLLIIFVMLVGGLGFVSYVNDKRDHERFQEFRGAVVAVCEQTNEGNARVNQALERLAQSALRNEEYPLALREERAEGYRSLFLSISECPPNQ